MSFLSRFAFAVVTAVLFLISHSAPSEAAWQWTTRLDTAVAQARNTTKPILVFFYADSSLPCRGMDKETWTDATVQAMAGDFVMTRLNVKTAVQEVNTFSVRSVPTTVFLDENGRFTGQVVGKLSAPEATGIMTTALDRFRRMPHQAAATALVPARQPAATPAPPALRPVSTPSAPPAKAPVAVAAAPAVKKPVVKPVVAQSPPPVVLPRTGKAPAVDNGVLILTDGDPKPFVPDSDGSGILVLDENGAVPMEKDATSRIPVRRETSPSKSARQKRKRR